TTTTEKHLLRQLDDRLEEVAQRPFRPGPGFGGPDEGRYSSFFVGQVADDGDVITDTRPVKGSGVDGAPNNPVSQIDRIPGGHQAFFSVGSEGGTRYRILAIRPPNGDPAIVYGTTRNDVDDVIRRLIWVEIAATAAIVAVLGLVTYWVVRLGVNPIKRMTRTA